MAPHELLIACIGKPSAGKSSFLNAVSNARAKVGNYPFTTIDPNRGVAFFTVPCPCLGLGLSSQCSPRYGTCTRGVRSIPVSILDVAGLIPGAHAGAGLGNRFLDDLRRASSFIHVVDASGTTDSEGKLAKGYDPTQDVAWLLDEIRRWIEGNLHRNWNAVKRKATANGGGGGSSGTSGGTTSLDRLLSRQLAGYGANRKMCQRLVAALPADLVRKRIENWDDDDIRRMVDHFVDVRFPMVVALNKIDLPDSDDNINRICMEYPEYARDDRILLVSALAENFLRKLHQERLIHYAAEEVDDGCAAAAVYTRHDFDECPESIPDHIRRLYLPSGSGSGSANAEGIVPPATSTTTTPATPTNTAELLPPLLPMDVKTQARLEKVLDLVLFRHGSTGCRAVINKAVELARVVPVYPVRSLHNFGPVKGGGGALAAANPMTASSPTSPSTTMTTTTTTTTATPPPPPTTTTTTAANSSNPVFTDCYLVPETTTVHDLAVMIFGESELERRPHLQAETIGGRQLGELDEVKDFPVIALRLRNADGKQ